MRRLSVLAAVVAMLLLLVGGGAALADPPFRLPSQITDKVGALSAGQSADVGKALDRLRTADGTQLFVVYVASFSGANGQDWAKQTAGRSQLGSQDTLLAVATVDRAYGYWADARFPKSTAELDTLLTRTVRPRLATGD